MTDNLHFKKLVDRGNPVGEVIGVDRYLVRIKGLQPINIHAIVMFEDGSKGFVQEILDDYVLILHLGNHFARIGWLVVMHNETLITNVGKDFVGRIVNVNGEPLDGKGPIAADETWPVFADAPMLYKREELDMQLETGVMLIDAVLPLVRGQRLALLGDSKSGKSTLATQIALHQKDTDLVLIYVLIAKRRSDIDTLVNQLTTAGVMQRTIVVVSTLSESLVASYLAPYVGCALGEYLWQKANQDTLVIYDDLTSHAQAYREISLLSNTSPGRDSYPGDIFYLHSSLLERAGRLSENHKSQTVIPLVLTSGGDIASYLPTNVMSITDGQWILDMKVFRDTVRPALNVGLSVTRVGGRGQNSRQKRQNQEVIGALGAYSQAEQYAHFGSEMGQAIQKDLQRGQRLYELFNQRPNETYNLLCQQLMVDIVINLQPTEIPNITELKGNVRELAAQVKSDSDFDSIRDQLKKSALLAQTHTPAPAVQKEQAP